MGLNCKGIYPNLESLRRYFSKEKSLEQRRKFAWGQQDEATSPRENFSN